MTMGSMPISAPAWHAGAVQEGTSFSANTVPMIAVFRLMLVEEPDRFSVLLLKEVLQVVEVTRPCELLSERAAAMIVVVLKVQSRGV